MELNRKAWMIALFFFLLGVGMMAIRIIHQEEPAKDFKKKGWKLTYDITARSFKPAGKLFIRIPDDTLHYRISRESFDYDNLSVAHDKSSNDGGRSLVAVSFLKQKPSRFMGEFELRTRTLKPKPSSLSSEQRQFYLREESKIQVNDPIFKEIGEQLTASKIGTTELIESIFTFVKENIERSSELNATDALSSVINRQADDMGKSRAMIALCRSLQIPARLVTGFILQPNTELTPHNWVEVYHKKFWHGFDPIYGYEWTVPEDHLPIVRNSATLISSLGTVKTKASFFLEPLSEPTATVEDNDGIWQIFNLERLPMGMRMIVSIILLMPFGVLITAGFRNLVGLGTFGTFSPTLLALSFVMSDWRTGLVILACVIIVGLSVRSVLERLKLLMVPRIGLILTLVIVLMTLAISIFDYFGLTPSANAVLLPTVIIAGLIERIYITEEEDGLQNVVKLLLGTIVVAISCFLVLDSDALRQLVIRFPETEFLVVGFLILIGRYSGYRLTELFRFNDMKRPLN